MNETVPDKPRRSKCRETSKMIVGGVLEIAHLLTITEAESVPRQDHELGLQYFDIGYPKLPEIWQTIKFPQSLI